MIWKLRIAQMKQISDNKFDDASVQLYGFQDALAHLCPMAACSQIILGKRLAKSV